MNNKKRDAASRTVSLGVICSVFLYRCCHSLDLAGYAAGTRFNIINMRLFFVFILFIVCIDTGLIAGIKLNQPSLADSELRSGRGG